RDRAAHPGGHLGSGGTQAISGAGPGAPRGAPPPLSPERGRFRGAVDVSPLRRSPDPLLPRAGPETAMMRLLAALLLASFLAQGNAPEGSPSEVQIHVRPDSVKATVGDRIVIQVEVTHPDTVSIDPPAPVPGEEKTLSVEPITPPPVDGHPQPK